MYQEEVNEMLYEAKTLEEVKTAVSAGADVNGFYYNEPVITRFIENNNTSLEMLEFLLKSGANVNIEYCDMDYTTTPFLSLFHGKIGEEGFSELENEKIKLMIRYGVDLDKEFVCDDCEDSYRYNALEFAIMSGSLDTVKILVLGGADINKVDHRTLEHCRNKSICKYLNDYRKSKVILENKKAYKKASTKNKKRQIGGVVVADKIAERIKSGKEGRVITPQVGKEIRQDIMKSIYGKKEER